MGDIVTATVLQATPDFTIVKIRDGVEAELPHYDQKRNPNERNERPMGEHYRHNQRIKVLIIDVRDPNSLEPRTRGEEMCIRDRYILRQRRPKGQRVYCRLCR